MLVKEPKRMDLAECICGPDHYHDLLGLRDRCRYEVCRCTRFRDARSAQAADLVYHELLDALARTLMLRRPSKKMAFVYLLESDNGLAKIGKALNPHIRMRTIKKLSASSIRLIHCFPCESALDAERWLHLRFNPEREHGEWFRLSEPDKEWICGIRVALVGKPPQISRTVETCMGCDTFNGPHFYEPQLAKCAV